jgi:hypothetical protein
MQFHILSFEGPDAYARDGVLATRVEGLAHALRARTHGAERLGRRLRDRMVVVKMSRWDPDRAACATGPEDGWVLEDGSRQRVAAPGGMQ